MRPFQNSWTEKQVEQLKSDRAAGLSAGQIASRLGCGLTRNAVLGKLHRLGLSRPAAVIERGRQETTRRRRRVKLNPHGRRGTPGGQSIDSIFEMTSLNHQEGYGDHKLQILPSDPPPSERMKEAELGRCVWPIGEGDEFGYCGRAKHKGSYCAAHHKRAYVPIQRGRKGKPFTLFRTTY